MIVRCRQSRNRSVIWTAANRFVVNTGRKPASLRWDPCCAVIVCKRHFAGGRQQRQLAGKSTAERGIGKPDWIGIDRDLGRGRAIHPR